MMDNLDQTVPGEWCAICNTKSGPFTVGRTAMKASNAATGHKSLPRPTQVDVHLMPKWIRLAALEVYAHHGGVCLVVHHDALDREGRGMLSWPGCKLLCPHEPKDPTQQAAHSIT